MSVAVVNKRVSDEAIIASYQRSLSIDKTAAELGLNRISVHERVVRLGIGKSINVFTDAERTRLRSEYLIYRDAGRLRALAASMNRTVAFLCRQARELGLTDAKHARAWAGTWKYMTEATARVLLERFRSQRKSASAWCKQHGIEESSFGRAMRKFFPDEWEAEIEAHAPKTLYRFGRQFEYRVRDALRELGFFCLRSPHSRSPIDLVAIRRGAVLFVQCKRHGVLGVAEWNALFDLALSVGAVPLMAETATTRGTILYWRLLERKDGSKRAQPKGAFRPEHA